MASRSDRVTLVRLTEASAASALEGVSISAVGPLSLEIGRGEFLSVVGPRACGKTLLLRMIAGLEPVLSGSVEFPENGMVAARVGIVFHKPSLLRWRTVLRNVILEAELLKLDREVFEQRARRLLASLSLPGLEGTMAHELRPEQARRVAICRALLNNPALLLMDDPFGSINFAEREQMVADLQRLWMESDFAVVLVTGELCDAVQLSDRVILMSQSPGRILQILDVDLPRPRRLDKTTTPLITDLVSRIRTAYHAQGLRY